MNPCWIAPAAKLSCGCGKKPKPSVQHRSSTSSWKPCLSVGATPTASAVLRCSPMELRLCRATNFSFSYGHQVRYENRQPPEGINVVEHGWVRDFVLLIVGFFAGLFLLCWLLLQ